MKDQVEEVKKKVKEFENQLVDLLKGEIERILTKIETAKQTNSVDKLNMKSVFKIYEELNGIKAINETRQSNAIEKIITFPDSGNIAINSTNESFKKIVNEEYEKYEKKQETYLKGLNPVISENVSATSKKNIQSEVLASKGKILVNQISEVAK